MITESWPGAPLWQVMKRDLWKGFRECRDDGYAEAFGEVTGR